MPFAGYFMDETVAFQLALGNLDAETLEQLDTYNPDTVIAKRNKSLPETNVSIWSRNFIMEQDSSVLIESESVVSVPDKETTARIKYSRLLPDEQKTDIYDDDESTSLCNMRSASSSMLPERKRKLDEMCSLAANQAKSPVWSKCRSDSFSEEFENKKLLNVVVSGLDTFAEHILGEKKSILGNFAETTVRKSDSFLKTHLSSNNGETLFQTSTTTSHIIAFKTLKQTRKVDSIKRKIVTGAKIQSENIATNSEAKPDTHLKGDIAFR